MNTTSVPLSKRMFRVLMRVLPADFRSDYGREMEHAFDDQAREARDRSGAAGVARVWWETLAGIFTTAPREHWEMLQQDTGYALRTMRKNLGFTCLAVLTLALGIGANTTVFTVINTMILNPLPVPDSARLVAVSGAKTNSNGRSEALSALSYPDFKDYQLNKSALASLAAYTDPHPVTWQNGNS